MVAWACTADCLWVRGLYRNERIEKMTVLKCFDL